jgi:hypothetical protein
MVQGGVQGVTTWSAKRSPQPVRVFFDSFEDSYFFDPSPMCCFNQAFTVSCRSTLFCGFSTQWFSSGK